MGRLYNFWTDDEATDLFHFMGLEETYENFVEYLKNYAPHLCKKSKALWDEMNS